METDILVQMVSNVGFPIAAFAAMYYMCNTTIKEVKDSIDNLTRSIDHLLDTKEVDTNA
jgi:hypothetical protein